MMSSNASAKQISNKVSIRTFACSPATAVQQFPLCCSIYRRMYLLQWLFQVRLAQSSYRVSEMRSSLQSYMDEVLHPILNFSLQDCKLFQILDGRVTTSARAKNCIDKLASSTFDDTVTDADPTNALLAVVSFC